MSIEDEDISLVTNMGIYNGIGRYASELRRILLPVLPKLKLYSISYFQDGLIPGAQSISRRYAKNYLQVPLTNMENMRYVKERKILKDRNLHFLGSDYSLASESQNSIITAHEFYYTFGDILLSNDGITILKELFYNYGEFKLGRQLRAVKYVVTPSHYAANQIRERFGITPTVIHETVDRNLFHPRRRNEARKSLCLPMDKILLLNVSGAGANKNLHTLSRILDRLPNDFALLKINHAVKGRHIINLGKIKDSDYPLYFSAADMYLNTSINEGFCLPLLESLSCGLPVISNCRATAEEIIGQSGLYVNNPIDPDEYVERITSSVDRSLLEELSAKALTRSNLFSDRNARLSYLNLYERAFT